MTDYNLLHRVGVSIGSCRNELTKAKTLEEVSTLADKLTDLERQIVLKRQEDVRLMIQRRESILKKIEQLNQELKRIDKQYHSKIEWYKRQVKSRIDELDLEVQEKKKELSEESKHE